MKELSVEDWIEEINRGLEFRKLYGLESSWAENEALFYNVAPGNAHAGPNIVYATGDSLMSTMSVPYPYVTIKPKRQEFTQGSRLLETTDNELIETMELGDEVECSVLSAFIYGVGIIKLGYDSEFGWDPSMDLGLVQRTPLGMTLTQFDKNQQRIEFGGPEPGMPWGKTVLPHDFVVPWGTRKLKHASWCAHRVIRHVEDCRGDVKYNTRGLRPVMSVKDFVESYKKVPAVYRVGQDITKGMSFGTTETGDSEYVELWEIHDRRTQKIYVIATGHDKFLRNEHDHLQLAGGLPFVEISLVPRARNFWVTSDAQYLKAIQNEASDIALQKSRHRVVSNLKFLFDNDILTEEDMEKLLESKIGAGIPVQGANGNLRDLIIPITPPQQYQFGVDMEENRRDARELSGFSRNQMGEYEQTGRRTAAEANIVNQASSLRMDRRQGALSKLYVNLFRKINPIIETYWQTPRWVELVGNDGAMQIMQFTGQHLKGDFKYSVGFSLALQETIQQRRQGAIQMYMAMRQDPLMNPFALARYLNLAYNDPEFTSIFQPGVLNGQIEMLSGMQQQLANSVGGGGNGMAGGSNGPKGASPKGNTSTSTGAKQSSSVQASSPRTY